MPDEKAVDQEMVREIRRLMQARRDREMEQRFGRDVRATEEYRVAQRQRAAARRRAQEQREKVAGQREAREAGDRERARGREEKARDTQAREGSAAGNRRERQSQQQQQQRRGAPPPGDARPPLTGRELEESRRRVAEAKAQIKRDNEMLAARKAAGQDRSHFQSM